MRNRYEGDRRGVAVLPEPERLIGSTQEGSARGAG